MRVAVKFIAIAVVVWLLLDRLDSSVSLSKLVESGIGAEATVVEADCKNHGGVQLAFAVSGKTYQHSHSASRIERACDSFTNGEKVPITYLPSNPDVNGIGRIKAQLQQQRIFELIASLIIAAAYAKGGHPWSIWWRRKNA